MAIRGQTIVIKGEVRCSGDLSVDCQITGPILCEGSTLTLTESAVVEGDMLAADITVFGRAAGQLIATECVDVRPQATVEGAVISPKLILHDGARMNGWVDPKRLDAALTVNRFQQRKRDAG
jgi:cytoskeletal protein CcmA (bactofilin family)